ncbi:hypothetical protein XBLMG947_3657 [Xanthomonas bromi]|uniref:Uncharacterized protein n=1 Tax=Xanthomonas bromi TaxID=56449 RepID=A0A1C3NR35_9XANT|nr:hypothetical protein XBLMG947_3657 [Xanthomonas bromi]
MTMGPMHSVHWAHVLSQQHIVDVTRLCIPLTHQHRAGFFLPGASLAPARTEAIAMVIRQAISRRKTASLSADAFRLVVASRRM